MREWDSRLVSCVLQTVIVSKVFKGLLAIFVGNMYHVRVILV